MSTDKNGIRTAGIIIIGDEILSGRVHDSNAFYLVSELRALGVSVKRILVIPDEIDIIGVEAVGFSEAYDHVFTSGGIGPTHDDVTIAGIAKGFGVRLKEHPELEKIFRMRYGNTLNDAIIKMTKVPDGAEIIMMEGMRYPMISFKNIYIFPGIPDYLKNKFSAIKERFRCSSFHIRQLFLNANELEIAGILNTAAAENRDVTIGSYPVLENPVFSVIITAESRSIDALERAVKALIENLPEDIIVKVE